jgi:hypothetical protein
VSDQLDGIALGLNKLAGDRILVPDVVRQQGGKQAEQHGNGREVGCHQAGGGLDCARQRAAHFEGTDQHGDEEGDDQR